MLFGITRFSINLKFNGNIKTLPKMMIQLVSLQSDCEVVPCEATVYVQPVESDLADRWNNLRDIVIPSPAGVL